MGLLAGPAQFPAVASFSTLAGPADSTYVMLAVSIPNSALRFQREGMGFYADYDVNVTFMDADSVPVRRAQGRETVRISTFSETGRTDESIVHQQGFLLLPGTYVVRLEALDANSSRGFRVTDTLHVPAYGPTARHVGTPMLVYEADGRSALAELPRVIANPRHTVPYGSGAARIYVESYDTTAVAVPVRVLAESGAAVWSGRSLLSVGGAVRHGVVDVPPDVLPLGRFIVEVGESDHVTARAPLVMTISEQWMVANFDDVLQFLRYIATSAELDSLRNESPAERREAWERFWDRRDPLPVTPLNEFRDEFFQRVRYATEAFREAGGRDGWNTDRGEVYIVLGPPSQVRERLVGGQAGISGQPNAVEWQYASVAGTRLNLVFRDRTGFGRYELEPSSAAAFRSVAERLKQRRTNAN
jgi:GWxTD domain-containing protein